MDHPPLQSFLKQMEEAVNSAANPEKKPTYDAVMSDITREELNAKLALVREELRADNERLRGDFARSSESISQLVGGLTASIHELKGDLKESRGDTSGMKTAVGMLQTTVSLSAVGLGLVIAIVGVFLAWEQLHAAQNIQPVAPAAAPAVATPIVIQLPYPPAAAQVASPSPAASATGH